MAETKRFRLNCDMIEKTAKRTRRTATAPVIPIDAAASPAPPAPRITGTVELVALERVKPNGWNPNRMTEFQVAATREGFRREGWLASFPLLIWRTDDAGHTQNLIIDGEHRWHIARELGFKKGPMVFLDGLTQKRAAELTIALDNLRGKFDNVALRDVLNDIGVDDDTAFRLGFDADTFAALMADNSVLPPSDFSEVTIDAKTDYTCPKCGYEWSGGQKGHNPRSPAKMSEA